MLFLFFFSLVFGLQLIVWKTLFLRGLGSKPDGLGNAGLQLIGLTHPAQAELENFEPE